MSTYHESHAFMYVPYLIILTTPLFPLLGKQTEAIRDVVTCPRLNNFLQGRMVL